MSGIIPRSALYDRPAERCPSSSRSSGHEALERCAAMPDGGVAPQGRSVASGADIDDTRGHEAVTGNPARIRLLIVATIGASIQVLYAGRLEYLSSCGFDVTVACASSDLDPAIRARGVRLRTFPFTRAITIWQDVRALVQLYRFLRAEQFDLVEVSTPKAALLGSLAAWGARTKCLVHVLHGAPYEGKEGILGALLQATTSVPCRLAHLTLAVSKSVAQRICDDGLGSPARIRVLGAGSCNGVDISRFAPDKLALGKDARASYEIPSDAVVIGFVGRLTRDKGVEELARAFEMVCRQVHDAVLLVVGDYEHRDRPSPAAMQTFSTHPQVRHVGWKSDVLPLMAAMDVLILPTRREGLPTVLLEAAALGLPTITTDATGARDAIIHETTGLVVPVGDIKGLSAALLRLASDPPLRREFGRAGRQWVVTHFTQIEVWGAQANTYRALVAQPDDGAS